MSDTASKLSLSAEELALAMSMSGNPQTGKLLLVSSFGELAESEERSRLYAAGHSLFARDLVTLVAGEAELTADLRRLLSVLNESDFSIQLLKQNGGLDSIVYAVQGENIVEQVSKQGVAY